MQKLITWFYLFSQAVIIAFAIYIGLSFATEPALPSYMRIFTGITAVGVILSMFANIMEVIRDLREQKQARLDRIFEEFDLHQDKIEEHAKNMREEEKNVRREAGDVEPPWQT